MALTAVDVEVMVVVVAVAVVVVVVGVGVGVIMLGTPVLYWVELDWYHRLDS